MEVTLPDSEVATPPAPWSSDCLRHVSYDQTGTTVFARSSGTVQRRYAFDSDPANNLYIRYAKNLPMSGTFAGHVWIQAHTADGSRVDLAVDPSYIFERTHCLITPKIGHWGGNDLVSIYNIVSAAVMELAGMLSIIPERLLEADETPTKPPETYLALDHHKECKVLITADTRTIAALEEQVRTYCPEFWSDRESMGRAIRVHANVMIYPTRSLWSADELALLQEGDLLAVQNFVTPEHGVRLRGAIRFRNQKDLKRQFEVFLEMNENDTRLQFGSDELTSPPSERHESPAGPLEEIELEIHAGKTTVLFSDLCSAQVGTLIELRDHSLPFVKLCVTGSPILEGELVNFQNQVMIQITKRLD